LGAKVVGYDLIAGKTAAKRLPSRKVAFDPYEVLTGAHAAESSRSRRRSAPST
jgi:hypothetical protein